MAHASEARTSDRIVNALVSDYVDRYPDEAARAMEQLPVAHVARQLEAVPISRAAAVVQRLTPQVAAGALGRVPVVGAARMLEAAELESSVAVLAWLDAERRDQVLNVMSPANARELRALAEYPPDSAGSLMDPRVVRVRANATVREALVRLRAARHRRIHDLFLVDDDGRLEGMVAVQDVAVAQPSTPLSSLTRREAVGVPAMDTRDAVVERLADRHVASLPVVDAQGHLIGVIRPETLVSVAQEEAGSDMQAMVGASREERALSSVSFAVRKRLPWLQINLATAFLAAAVVGLFETTIAQFTALAVLLPVVAGQSGNTGAQALAVTMRGLALREVRVRHWLRIAVKEMGVALINGCAVAVTTAAGVYLWSGSTGLSLVIGLAMVISMLAAGFAGAVIPMALTATGQDPAQSSSIVLTTVTDVVGFFSFLGIATLLAGLL